MAISTDRNLAACQRCGTCCEQGGPALHLEDRELLAGGTLKPVDLVTIRAGEPAHDPRLGQVVPAAREFLKLAGSRGGWCCRFYERQEKGCGIYRHRPLECRLLSCRDTAPLEAVMGRELLTRRDLLEPDDQVLYFLERQEREIPYAEVLARLDDPTAGPERLNELVRADLELRRYFLRLFPARERQELFLFGRPLFLVLAPFGYRLAPGVTPQLLRVDR